MQFSTRREMPLVVRMTVSLPHYPCLSDPISFLILGGERIICVFRKKTCLNLSWKKVGYTIGVHRAYKGTVPDSALSVWKRSLPVTKGRYYRRT